MHGLRALATISCLMTAFAFPATMPDGSAAAAVNERMSGNDLRQIREGIEASEYELSYASSTALADGPAAWQAPNRRQGFRAYFPGERVELVPRDTQALPWRLGIELMAWGPSGRVARLARAAIPEARGARVEIRRDAALTEWFVNAPAGLEHGFTVARAPEGTPARHLIFDLALRGGFRAEPIAGGDERAIRLVGPRGEALRYAGLEARDATGRSLRAAMRPAENGIRVILSIAAVGASYPVTIDPTLSQEAKLQPHEDGVPGQPDAWCGEAVSLDRDRAVIGCRYYDFGANKSGAAFVFSRQGGEWTSDGRLVAADAAENDQLGGAVSLSGDTVLVGAANDDLGGGAKTGSVYVFVRSGSSWTQQAKLVAPGGMPADQFGFTVALSGDTAVVGATPEELVRTGAAYVFVRTGSRWTLQAKLLGHDATRRGGFGGGVAVSGDTAIVNAPAQEAAYVFVRSGAKWSEQQKLVAEAGLPGDSFGFSVAVAGDTALIGAFSDTELLAAAPRAGAAYVFVRAGGKWSRQQKLVASDGRSGDGFGFSVTLSGNTAVVGASENEHTEGNDAGSAYVFVRSGTKWQEQQKLVPPDASARGNFGQSVSLSGDTVLVSARLDDTLTGTDAGSAYVFTQAGSHWAKQAKLEAGETVAFDRFGASVALSDDTLVVGANGDDRGENAGAAYVFVRAGSTWAEQQKLRPSDLAAGDNFGYSVAVSGDTVVVGSPAADHAAGKNAGAAYVFVRSGTAWHQQAKLIAAGAAAGDQLGTSVAVDGNTVVVGAVPSERAARKDAGAVHVFVRTGATWKEQQALRPADAKGLDRFGDAVALAGDTLVVGAPVGTSPSGLQGAGAAYVFVRAGGSWKEQQKLVAPDAGADDHLGSSVALSGNTIVVGAVNHARGAVQDVGAAYVFVRSGAAWSLQAQLVGSDATTEDELGIVSLSGDTIVVSTQFHDRPGAADAGAAYVFARSGTKWNERAKLAAADGRAGDRFGVAVATSGDRLAVGAFAPVGGAMKAGAVYVFESAAADHRP